MLEIEAVADKRKRRKNSIGWRKLNNDFLLEEYLLTL
jgi:hypothetical protein